MAGLMMQSNMKGRMERERERADEDLSLFRELRKRQNERVSTLLHCASEDYELHDSNAGSGKFSLYRIPSGKKEHGLEYLVETNKNEYDWLKTPPATPLFPSLEMEPGAQLVVQKEIPISQPISRVPSSSIIAIVPSSIMDQEGKWQFFAGGESRGLCQSFAGEALKPKANDGTPNHTKAKLPARSITPGHNRQRPSNIKNTNVQQPASIHPTIIPKKSSDAKIEHNTKSIPQRQRNNADFLALNPKKSMEASEPQGKPKTRGVSPSVRSRITSNMLELSNEAPPNLRTEQRPGSTTRGRSTTRASKVVGSQNLDPTPRSCRPSRSPSPSVSNGGWIQLDKTQKSLKTQKERFTLAAGNNESGAHFVGSKMVEKVVKARKSGINQAEKETKPKPLKYRV